MHHQEILFGNLDQVFFLDPPDGRPDASPAPEVHVYADTLPVDATRGPCRIDPVDTAMYGDTQRSSRSMRVTSAAGIAVGGRYLMTKPEGDREWIEVVAIDGDRLTLKHPILHRYAGAASIVGCRISVAVNPAWASRRHNVSEDARGLAGYVLRWRYAIRGHLVTTLSYADLVYHQAAVVMSTLAEPAPDDHDFVAEAVRVIRLEAAGDRHAQRVVHDMTALRELVALRSHLIRVEHDVMFGAPRGDELAAAEERYRRCYERLVRDRCGDAKPRRRPVFAPAPEVEPPRPAAPRPTKARREPGTVRRIPKLT